MMNHIAIVMDGNRRFSKRLMQMPWQGHAHGAKKLKEVMEWCKEKKIHELTLYTFSYENFDRPEKEFNFLMELFRKEFKELMDNEAELEKNKLQIKFIGRLEKFPKDIQDMMHEIMQKTQKFSDAEGSYKVNFAMGYSGRVEIADAMKKMIDDYDSGNLEGDAINQDTIKRYLYLDSEPEIIIRTGGEKRLSNFLLYQSGYSELFFVDSLWPEFSKEEFDNIIDEFENRERRFGK
ncbi:di-trans,poly-cis-decaprenylcistransferase [Candidatus Woesearchaeota archaeon]|nr:di-trans,poly-cis-decaprenylcistransferase [Candidatus Woesearchaeota archaeon]